MVPTGWQLESDGAPTECPNDSEHEIVAGQISVVDRRSHVTRDCVPAFSEEGAYLTVDSAIYQDRMLYYFEGLDIAEVWRCVAIVSAENTDTVISLRLFDVDNDKVIVEKTGITFAAAYKNYEVDLGAVSVANMSTAGASWILQTKKTAGSPGRISLLGVFY
jgi:hypothetical protein